jgi:transposase
MKVLEQVSLRCGAEPGAGLLQIFSLNVSSDKLLRCAHQLELAPKACPKRIGIDDFAFRKGISYGTIIVDLDSGKAIDLLKSRQVDVVADWLKEHPHIDLVTRDRARDYSLAITQGATQAVQVMDRWHVLKNLREALQIELSSRYDEMKQVFKRNNFAGKALPRSRKEREAKALVMKIKKDRHAQVHKLHQQGMAISHIAQRLNLSRQTVYAYLQSPEVPQFIRKKRECLTDHYKSHLEMRYQEAKMNIKEVWCELKKKMSYTGSYQSVWRWFYERRQLPEKLMGLKISPRHFASLFVKDEAKLTDREQLIINALDTVPELKQLRSWASDFREALLQSGSAAMKVWLAGVAETPFRFLGNLAQSLKGEWASLMAACDTSYSNGPTEGAVNRLKTIKRMMYGRGSFELLRKRVLLS